MEIEEIPIYMGPKVGFWYVVVVDDEIFVLTNTIRLAYFYGSLRKRKLEINFQKKDPISGVPTFLKFAETHPVLKKVRNWSIFGTIH